MKITKNYLKKVIKEELEQMEEVSGYGRNLKKGSIVYTKFKELYLITGPATGENEIYPAYNLMSGEKSTFQDLDRDSQVFATPEEKQQIFNLKPQTEKDREKMFRRDTY